MSTKYQDRYDRAAKLAYNAKLEPDSVKEVQLILLIMLTDHIAACQVHWARRGNRALYERALEAWRALCKACMRPTQYLDLTTSEYRAIRATLLLYLNQLENMKVGDFVGALKVAREKLDYANGQQVLH